MAAKKGGLGKGIDTLISNKVNTRQLNAGIADDRKQEAVKMVKLSRVEPNREQPRQTFEESALAELADSIRQFGIIQPLIVQDKTDYYEIIAGERRWRAARLAGLKEVPVIVRDSSEQEIMEIALIENIQREDLNPIEEARAYKRLLDEFRLKQEDLAKRVSKSRAAIANTMRLLKLCEDVQQMIIDKQLTNGHARCLISVEDEAQQRQLARQIVDKGLSVRETETLIKQTLNGKKPAKKKQQQSNATLQAIYESLAEKMKQALGTKVEIRRKDDVSGKIEIEYYSQDELDRITQLIQSIRQ